MPLTMTWLTNMCSGSFPKSNPLSRSWLVVASKGNDSQRRPQPAISISNFQVISKVPDPLPIGILFAIKQRMNKDPNFAATFPGGAFFAQAPTGSPVPYVVFSQVSSRPQWMTGPGYYETESVSASIWTTDGDAIKSLGYWLERWLDRSSYQRIDGYTSTMIRQRSIQFMSPERDTENNQIYSYNVDYECITSKTL